VAASQFQFHRVALGRVRMSSAELASRLTSSAKRRMLLRCRARRPPRPGGWLPSSPLVHVQQATAPLQSQQLLAGTSGVLSGHLQQEVPFTKAALLKAHQLVLAAPVALGDVTVVAGASAPARSVTHRPWLGCSLSRTGFSTSL